MGSYGIDSHNIQRYITPEGFVQNEGDIGVSTNGPYQIAYGSMVPKRGQADNLLVPVCVSSSHIAFGSIRMEPVFMILGQSAATAAALAIDARPARAGRAVRSIARAFARGWPGAREAGMKRQMPRWSWVVMWGGAATVLALQGETRFQWPDGKRVALSLSFDDGRASQVEGGAALLDRHGVKATFYVTPSSVEPRLDGLEARRRGRA